MKCGLFVWLTDSKMALSGRLYSLLTQAELGIMGLIVGDSAAKDILHTLLAFGHLGPLLWIRYIVRRGYRVDLLTTRPMGFVIKQVHKSTWLCDETASALGRHQTTRVAVVALRSGIPGQRQRDCALWPHSRSRDLCSRTSLRFSAMISTRVYI
jgi:hypothetical protein